MLLIASLAGFLVLAYGVGRFARYWADSERVQHMIYG